jgi:hypothetical protein
MTDPRSLNANILQPQTGIKNGTIDDVFNENDSFPKSCAKVTALLSPICYRAENSLPVSCTGKQSARCPKNHVKQTGLG